MDLGNVTLLIAITFSVIGIVVGIVIAKFLTGREPTRLDLKELKENIEGLSDRINFLVEELKEKIEKAKSERIEELNSEVEMLLLELEKLKNSLRQLDLSEDSISALDRAELLLREVDFHLPKIDESLLTQIKDSLLILRNDIETLLAKTKDISKPVSPVLDPSVFDSILTSLDLALAISRKLNAHLVKGELIALANSLKVEELSSFVRELDDQALNSKELVIILEEVKKKLEEVKNEASLRR